MSRCPNCGSAVGPDERYCGECGYELSAGGLPQAGDQPADEVKGRRWILWLGALGLLALCGVCFSGTIFVRMGEGGALAGLSSRQEPSLATAAPTDVASPGTEIHQVWLEHNVPYEGVNYLVVHVEFEVARSEAERVEVVGLVWTADGAPMEALEPDYSVGTQAGIADVGLVEFSPTTYWDDYRLWMPYYALRIGEDHHWTVEIADESGRILDAWRTETFNVEP